MNPPPREIRVLFVPPALRGGMGSPISLRTPLTPSKTLRRFPPSPWCSTASLFLSIPRSPSAYAHRETQERTHTHIHSYERFRLAVVLGEFHSLEISCSQYALPTLRVTGRGVTCLTLFATTLFVYVSLCGAKGDVQRRFRAVIRETAVSGYAKGCKCAQ